MNSVLPIPLAIESKRGLAMMSMVLSSVVISFGGLIMRSMEVAGPWQINFYRSIALLGAVSILIIYRFRAESLSAVRNIGPLGVIAGMFLYASRHLAAAEVTLFMLLEFALGPIWVWLFVNEQASRWTIIGGLLIILAIAIRAVLELAYESKSTRSLGGPV